MSLPTGRAMTGKEATMPGYRYKLAINHAGKWFFTRVSRNGEIQYMSQAYANKSNARRAIRRLDPDATIVTIDE